MTQYTNKNNKLQKFYIVRQKSSGFVLPYLGKGATWAEFESTNTPRLFTTQAGASRSLAYWLRGTLSRQSNQVCFDFDEGGYITDDRMQLTKVPERNPEDYEVVKLFTYIM